MSGVVATRSSGVAAVAWDPLAKPVADQWTTYLLDLDVEEALTTLAAGRMIGLNEAFGTAADSPYWLGGNKVLRAPGKYRDGLKAQGTTTYHALAKPSVGLIGAARGAAEFVVTADVAWSVLSQQTVFQVINDSRQYMDVLIHAGVLRLDYRHEQLPGGEVNKQVSAAYAGAANQKVSVAYTWAAGVLTLYVEGVSVGTVTGATPPRFWADNMSSTMGISVSAGADHCTVSDLRISSVDRVPGQVPS